jgi:hypothetical protein
LYSSSTKFSFPFLKNGSKDAGDDCREEGKEEKEKEADLFYGRPESFLSAITASAAF